MPRAVKGQRFGGRAKGVPNKKTIERLERERITEQVATEVAKQIGVTGSVAEIAVRKAMEGRKLAKDELEEVVPTLRSIVAKFQKPAYANEPGAPAFNLTDWDNLRRWMELFIDTCVRLADFQSPKFRAMFLSEAPAPLAPANANNVVTMPRDAISRSRLYQRVVNGVQQ